MTWIRHEFNMTLMYFIQCTIRAEDLFKIQISLLELDHKLIVTCCNKKNILCSAAVNRTKNDENYNTLFASLSPANIYG